MRIQDALRVHNSFELTHEVEFQSAVLACGVVALESPKAVLSGDRASELHRVSEQPSGSRAHQTSFIVVKDERRVQVPIARVSHHRDP